VLLIAIRLVRARPASPHPYDHDSLLLHSLSIIGLPKHASDTAARIDAYLAATLEFAADTALQDARAVASSPTTIWVAVASLAGPTGGGYTQAAGRCSSCTCEGDVLARAGTQAGDIARATLN
jgi:hypothetical protein